MRLSVNEIELTLRRAARGAGWPWGLAEDLGRAAAWAAARGLDAAVPEAVDAITEGFAVPVARREGPVWILSGNVAATAPSAMDLLLAADGAVRVSLEGVAAPALLTGYAGLTSSVAGRVLRLEDESGLAWCVSATDVVTAASLSKSGVRITVSLGPPARPIARGMRPPPTGIPVAEDLWRRVLELALAACVPASEESRLHGAGAGLVDPD